MPLDNERKHDFRAAFRTLVLYHEALEKKFDLGEIFSEEKMKLVEDAMRVIEAMIEEQTK